MQRFKTAVFGTGFVGRVHLEGIRRLGNVDLYAIGEPQIEKANQLAAEFGVTITLSIKISPVGGTAFPNRPGAPAMFGIGSFISMLQSAGS